MKEINCPNCNQHIKILGTDYDLYLENLKREEQEIKRLKEEYMILQNASDKVEEEKDKEIERLQDLCNKYEKEHKTTYEIWKKDIYLYNSMVDRIDKAIEYIENNSQIYIDTRGEELEEIDEFNNLCKPSKLLDILKGSGKE